MADKANQASPPKGFLLLTLHAHLPFVRHPEHEQFLEEEWFFEAITETYLPLLSIFEGLDKDKVPFRVTMTLSPTLVAMLNDDLLKERYLAHLTRLLDLADLEVTRTKDSRKFHDLANMYRWRLESSHQLFTKTYDGDLIKAFISFYEKGNLEIITTAATHGYLPLIAPNEEAVRAQIAIACQDFERVFGRRPAGIWLPECGYQPGFENVLQKEGLNFFFTDAHGVLHATPRPRYGVFAPLETVCGVSAFGRDLASSKQVWSSRSGYPGDPAYRDFYRDIGFDLDMDYIGPYVQPTGHRKMTGFKYYRITSGGDGGDNKEAYSYHDALAKAEEHAADFVKKRIETIDALTPLMDRPPVIVSPYDAELFGHWWFEGPEFLNFLFRKIAAEDLLEAITPSEYLKRHPVNQVAIIAQSSWGEGGHNDVWLDETNDWIYRRLHKAADRMVKMATCRRGANGVVKRALNQAARELLLAQSSDWAFIMKTGTMAPYAIKRTKESLANFTQLYDQIENGNIDEAALLALEEKNCLFPDIDFTVYSAKPGNL